MKTVKYLKWLFWEIERGNPENSLIVLEWSIAGYYDAIIALIKKTFRISDVG